MDGGVFIRFLRVLLGVVEGDRMEDASLFFPGPRRADRRSEASNEPDGRCSEIVSMGPQG